ncbi:phosphosulfolactate synthase [Mechercharimyces sp. CAU 1602]|uniref:phosphosulfolactate synthase n=1 Tax=Mechercharimyces sp. CAU 1602 TaxID=2973933 RepID=UPI0021639A95|nr:phosphosulfolactate synthase [Mechercharimyces sp. CAU 1602]MCS1350762.1 phosphosulfolactate synthase [Mechercharimyces sp. CAU 1602]
MKKSFPKWEPELQDPTSARPTKPRQTGITMLIDKGLGISAFQDLLELGANHIDFIKLGFGTSALTPRPLLQKKVELASHYQVGLYPGGTFFEVAFRKKLLPTYFQTLSSLGFEWIEISDGSITLSAAERSQAIKAAVHHGFQVITEIGKKESGSITDVTNLTTVYKQDRHDGAKWIIVEGRESGKGIGIFDESGHTDTQYVKDVERSTGGDHLIWETPHKEQQVALIHCVGPHVNLGNIASTDLLALEALRRGLRADTFSLWGASS